MNFLKSLDFKLVGIIIALVAAESFAQLFLETATLKSKKDINLVLGIILYLIVGYLYYIALTSNVPLAIVI